jgi:hypothetical protein
MATAKSKASAAKARPETHRIVNLVPSAHVGRDWDIGNALAANSIAAPVAALPASVDLRAPWWEIGDQGSTGSCVGWGSTDGVARYHFVQAGKLGKTDKLSVRFTWLGSKETDTITTRPQTFIEQAGTTLKAAVDILKKYGAVPAATLPFQIANFLYLGDENTFYTVASQRRIAAYFNLGKDVAAWRTWLATHGPILAGLNVDSTWDNAKATKGKLDTFNAASARGGHAIAIVGYTADKRFIVRNSWGTGWGDGGFAYASEAYIAGAFFNESYGITL